MSGLRFSAVPNSSVCVCVCVCVCVLYVCVCALSSFAQHKALRSLDGCLQFNSQAAIKQRGRLFRFPWKPRGLSAEVLGLLVFVRGLWL